jgi:hypothetical protein
MKKISTHFQLHTVDHTVPVPGENDPFPEEHSINEEGDDLEELLANMDIKVPERVVQRLFLKIRISTLRHRN